MLTLTGLKERIEDDRWYRGQFGTDPEVIRAKRELARYVLTTFLRSFPSGPETKVAACFVPGRVEILGKHTDYAGGHSLLAALDRGFFCLSALNGTNRVRMVEHSGPFPPCDFEISTDTRAVGGHWSNYPITMVKRMALNFGELEDGQAGGESLHGVDIAFGSDLPVAAGMSGSSALMIMTFFALAIPNELMERDLFRRAIRNRLDLAMYLACAENGQTFGDLVGGAGVGTFGGSEDHTQILNGKPGQLSLYQFCPTVHRQDVPWPEEMALVIAHSGVPAQKTGAAQEQYNLVSRRAVLAVGAYNRRCRTGHKLLRDLANPDGCADEATLVAQITRVLEEADRQNGQFDLPGRFTQFYREERHLIPAAVSALQRRDFRAFGRLVDESHLLSRVHLHNIIPEIDHLQESARRLGAVAASGFGAGFGGSAYAVVPGLIREGFLRSWQKEYQARFPGRAVQAEFLSVKVSGPAGEMGT